MVASKAEPARGGISMNLHMHCSSSWFVGVRIRNTVKSSVHKRRPTMPGLNILFDKILPWTAVFSSFSFVIALALFAGR